MAKVVFRKDVEFNIPEAAHEYAKKVMESKDEEEEE